MVQGLDYAYTLQGWLKGVNSTSLTPGYDMGRDGDTTWQNRYVGRDAFGFGLNYFAGDYSAIGTSANPFPGTSAYLNTSYRPLYNGNISSMAVNIAELYKFDSSSHWRGPMLYNYHYDQLNRITGMDAFYGLNQSTNSWSALTATPDFKERVAYDPNGNIQKYLRNNFGGTGLPMDSLGYGYMTGTNKLLQIKDSASDVIGGGYDLHSQPTNNYAYDSIGNLIKDSIEHISLIKWNVYGKITEIDHSTTTLAKPTKNIYYYYDAAGNRIGKKTTSGDSSTVSYTWYVRDAAGNVMATYTAGIDSSSALSSADLHVGEKDIYGSSRLGLLNANYSVDAAGDGFSAYTSPWTGAILPYYTGRKQYELANHLGNVLATISDKKIGVSLSADSSLIDHYAADVQTAQDYYPFGMIMPGRMFTSLSIPGGSIDSGTSQVNGYTLPVDLTLTSRTSDMPNQYVATQMIDLDQGFGSGDSTDVFTAYIADTSYAGTGNGGSDPDGVAGQGKYRYGFNGKEQDNEVKGVGDQIDYGMRIYDPRVGRFLSVDPLQQKYFWLTPYQFGSNKPIAGIDLDGKEYLGSNISRVDIVNGIVKLKMANMHSITKNTFEGLNDDPKNWAPGQIGISTTIGSFNFNIAPPITLPDLNVDNGYGANDPNFVPGKQKIEPPIANSTGLPDRRYTKDNNVEAASPGGAKALAVTSIALDAIIVGEGIARKMLFDDDFNKARSHAELALQALFDVYTGVKEGIIPKEYKTEQYLSDIANVVLSGVSNLNDKKVIELGREVYNNISKRRFKYDGQIILRGPSGQILSIIPKPNPTYDANYGKKPIPSQPQQKQ